MPSSAAASPSATEPDPDPERGLDDGMKEVGRRMKAMEDEYRKTPPEVELELKHRKETYRPLPALRRLPDFLSTDTVVALIPEENARSSLRSEIHTQLEGGDDGPLLGSYLDEQQERLFALWIATDFTQVLAVFDGSRLASKQVVSRGGRPLLGEVLTETDGERPEILIESITSMSVCCHPLSLDLMRVSRRGVLSEVLSFPSGHADVGPGERWTFLNHFEFEGERVRITSAYPLGGPSYELVFDKRAGRYLPTPETAKQLAAEARAQRAQTPEN